MTSDNCRMGQLVSAYLDGEAEAADRERVEKHLLECEECRRFQRRCRELEPALREASPPPPVPEERWERMLQVIRAAPVSVVVRRRRRLKVFGSAAAVFAAAAAILLTVLVSRPSGGGMREYLPAADFEVQSTAADCQTVLVAATSDGGLNMLVVAGSQGDTDQPDSGWEPAGGVQ